MLTGGTIPEPNPYQTVHYKKRMSGELPWHVLGR